MPDGAGLTYDLLSPEQKKGLAATLQKRQTECLKTEDILIIILFYDKIISGKSNTRFLEYCHISGKSCSHQESNRKGNKVHSTMRGKVWATLGKCNVMIETREAEGL